MHVLFPPLKVYKKKGLKPSVIKNPKTKQNKGGGALHDRVRNTAADRSSWGGAVGGEGQGGMVC